MNQVLINPTKLSILSINRSKYWLFKSAILEFLYTEVDKAKDEDISSASDSEEEQEDDDFSFNPRRHLSIDETELSEKFDSLNVQGLNGHYSLSSSSSRSASRPLSRPASRPGSVFGSNSFTGTPGSASGSHTSARRGKKHSSSSSNSSFNYDNTTKDLENTSKRRRSDSFPNLVGNSSNKLSESDDSNDSAEESNYFFHIAFTPNECTIICSSTVLLKLFKEPLRLCRSLKYDDVKLIDQKFVNLQIDSGGVSDTNSRILELTKPLSENKISLFFLSSHFSDIVLIPYDLEEKVINILTNNNFEFNDISGSYIVNNNYESFVKKSLDSDTTELENRTFALFKQANIKPVINEKVALLLTGSRSNDVNQTILKTAKNIAANNVPDYFAITRTSINEVSLILPKSSKQRASMGFNSKYLIGSTQDIIKPVTIDLQKLPLDSTGIVAGVASKIINGVNSFPSPDNYSFELNYLSMARSAILMIPKENVKLVSEILNNTDYSNLQ